MCSQESHYIEDVVYKSYEEDVWPTAHLKVNEMLIYVHGALRVSPNNPFSTEFHTIFLILP
jgi:hypothetical protein